MKKQYLLVILISALIFISSCTKNNECKGSICIVERDSCNTNQDCACGVWKDTQDDQVQCAYGNKDYIDSSTQCPDFCTGIANNLEIKCVDNKCKQVQKEVSTIQCNTDKDCATGGCSGQLCGKKGEVEDLITTCEYLPVYDCYKKTTCSCIDNKCDWKKTDEFTSCLKENSGAVEVQ